MLEYLNEVYPSKQDFASLKSAFDSFKAANAKDMASIGQSASYSANKLKSMGERVGVADAKGKGMVGVVWVESGINQVFNKGLG